MGDSLEPTLVSAADDLEWWWCARHADVGFHGQIYDTDRVGGSFDPEAAHVAKRSPRHREAAARERRVSAIVDRMPFREREWSRLAYQACGDVEPMVREAFAMGRGRGSLARLAMVTRSAVSLRTTLTARAQSKYDKAVAKAKTDAARQEIKPLYVPRDTHTFLAWCVASHKSAIVEIRREAQAMLARALECYLQMAGGTVAVTSEDRT